MAIIAPTKGFLMSNDLKYIIGCSDLALNNIKFIIKSTAKSKGAQTKTDSHPSCVSIDIGKAIANVLKMSSVMTGLLI